MYGYRREQSILLIYSLCYLHIICILFMYYVFMFCITGVFSAKPAADYTAREACIVFLIHSKLISFYQFAEIKARNLTVR